MEWHIVLAAVSGVFLIVSVSFYVRDMLCGTTRPNLISYVLWFVLGSIAIAAQISSGASWSIVLPVVSVSCVGFILFLIALGYGHKQYRVVDGVCFFLALLALVLWYVTDEPRIALILSITASFIAVTPTIVKTYYDPFSEHALAWFLTFIGAAFSLASTRILDIANVAYPIYVLIEGGIVTALAFFGQCRSRGR